MANFLNKIRSRFSFKLMRESEIQRIAAQAAERAIQEERKWYEGALDQEDDKITVEDLFQLYASDDGKIEGIENRKLQEAADKWISGRSIVQGVDLADDQPLDYLHLMQRIVKSKYYSDPHVRSIINNWTFYTMGSGLKILMPTDDLTLYVSKFRNRNKMIRREKQFVKSLFQDGELFIAYYLDKNSGQVDIRRIRPQEIVEIEHHPEDIENIFAFRWEYEYSPAGSMKSIKRDQWVRSITYDTWIKGNTGFKKASSRHSLPVNPMVQFVKFGDDTELRGRVPIQPVLKLLKNYQDWLDDRIRLNHERAKVVWIKEVKGRGADAKKRDRRSPRGGVMLVENENVKYRIENPKLASDDAKEDGLQILYTIGAGTSLPIHILNQRSDEQVYASIRKADTPFAQFIRYNQELIGEEMEVMYRVILKSAVDAGKLPKQVEIPIYTQEALTKAFEQVNEMHIEGRMSKEIVKSVSKILKESKHIEKVDTHEVPITIDFPEIIREDMKEQAEVLSIHAKLGIASRATLSAKAGYNWKQELQLMRLDQDDNDKDGDGIPDDEQSDKIGSDEEE